MHSHYDTKLTKDGIGEKWNSVFRINQAQHHPSIDNINSGKHRVSANASVQLTSDKHADLRFEIGGLKFILLEGIT